MDVVLDQLYVGNWQEQLAIALQMLIAALLGGLVGLEREKAQRPAGLRTHAILAAATALLVGMTSVLINQAAAEVEHSALRADPVRVIEAIATGVSFLGAGTVFRHHKENVIEGLTTAASLLLVAAIGVAVALGQLIIATIATVTSLLLLRVARRFTAKVNHAE